MDILTHDPIHSRIFEAFVIHCAANVQIMKSSEHGWGNNPNPYHMEGDVWTHTCLCYNALLCIDEYHRLSAEEQFLACVAVLCHDLGKPYVRQINSIGRPRFIGHEKRSVVETINIVGFLSDILLLNDLSIYTVLAIVSAHSEYWTGESMQVVVPLLNYDESALKIYKVVAMADQMGQIKKDGRASKKDIFDFEFDLSHDNRDRIGPTAYVLVGPPASGKDTIIGKFINNVDVFSFDQMRIEQYQAANAVDDSLTPNELYSRAWEWCNNKKINFMPLLGNSIRELLINGKDVAISNTSMTRKSREALTHRIRSISSDINIVAIMSVVSEAELIRRDADRATTDKTVGRDVILRMNNYFELPTLNEDFDSIGIVINQ